MRIDRVELDGQINRFGVWSAVVAIVTIVISLFLPLDVPGGYSALQADRVDWLIHNRSLFIVGWINQIIAMFSLSGVFFAIAWRIIGANPLRAMIAAMVVAFSVMAFIIPKFIAVWTIPLLADAIANPAAGHELAAPLLQLLNVSVPFSLYTSFDYLGFWLYALFGLLVAVPLYQEGVSTKIAALGFGLFGLIYHLALVALLVGALSVADIEGWFVGIAGLLIVPVVAALFVFRRTQPIPANRVQSTPR